jgi:hypothetical protein
MGAKEVLKKGMARGFPEGITIILARHERKKVTLNSDASDLLAGSGEKIGPT